MFSGIVEKLATVKEIRPSDEGKRLYVEIGKEVVKGSKIGDSISINGACLTVSELDGSVAAFDLMPETLSRTNLGLLEKNSKVNMERSLKMSDRNHGHFVMGHVDCTSKILKKESDGKFAKIWFSCDDTLLDFISEKGSVTIDGISLTIVDVEKNRFSVALIPHTLGITTLGFKEEGDLVNVEIDMLARYVRNILSGQVSK